LRYTTCFIFAEPDFFVPAFAVIVYSDKRRHKKGGVND